MVDMTTGTQNMTNVHSEQKRRKWTPEEKKEIIEQTYQPGMSVSIIARKYGIIPSQLFNWRKLMEQGALNGIKTEEEMVGISEVKVLEKKVKELERALGRITLDNEILKEAIRIGRKKKVISQKPLEGLENFQ